MLFRRLSIGLAIAALVTATSCADSDSADDVMSGSTAATTSTTTTTTAPIAERRPFEATHVDRTYHRVAADGSDRTLLTEVWLPAGPGPYPLIAFAHGNDGHPRKFHELFMAWTEAGYAVVAPRFPVSADDANRTLEDSVADGPEQNLDLESVTTQLLGESAVTGKELSGRIDPSLLAVAGLSLGGGTALQSSYSDCCPGLKPQLVMAFSPVPYETGQPATAPPLLLVHGTADPLLPYSGSQDYFAKALNPRWFVSLTGAGHADPYEDSPSAHDELVRQITVDFLDQFLLGDDDGVTRAESTIAASGIATVESAK